MLLLDDGQMGGPHRLQQNVISGDIVTPKLVWNEPWLCFYDYGAMYGKLLVDKLGMLDIPITKNGVDIMHADILLFHVRQKTQMT